MNFSLSESELLDSMRRDKREPAADSLRATCGFPERRQRLPADRPDQLRRPRARSDDRHSTAARRFPNPQHLLVPGLFARIAGHGGNLGIASSCPTAPSNSSSAATS